jgi:coatomer subunit beta
LTKLREPELLESLIPSVKGCLTHRHPYVRRNAVLAVFTIFRAFPDLIPDAPEDITRFMEEETDAGTRRNAFIMMFNCAPDQAIAFLTKNVDSVLQFGDGFALILLELIRKTVRSDASRKAKFIRIVFALLENPSPAVSYEAASTLVSLSGAPSAVRAASQAFIRVLLKESDNNVKLIVLERLAGLRKRHAKVLRELVMDVLRCLSTPNNDIRRRTLDVAMDLVSPRNVEEVMGALKKEILATQDQSAGSSGSGGKSGSGGGDAGDAEGSKYRTMLINAIHGCAVRFPEVAPSVVQLLMDFLNGDGALSVIEFVREIVETYPVSSASGRQRLRRGGPLSPWERGSWRA